MASDVAKEKFRDSLAAGIDKYVKMPGRNTISQNCERDSGCAGYARIPGPDACDFCVTMGASNDFYHSEATAGGGLGHGTADDAYHPYCNCQIAVIFKKRGRYVARDPETGSPIEYDGKKLVERYNEIGRPTYANKSGRGDKGSTKPSVLPQDKFDEAMKMLADAKTVDELHDVGGQIVAGWPKRKAGRDPVQWKRMSSFAKEREAKLGSSVEQMRVNVPTISISASEFEKLPEFQGPQQWQPEITVISKPKGKQKPTDYSMLSGKERKRLSDNEIESHIIFEKYGFEPVVLPADRQASANIDLIMTVDGKTSYWELKDPTKGDRGQKKLTTEGVSKWKRMRDGKQQTSVDIEKLGTPKIAIDNRFNESLSDDGAIRRVVKDMAFYQSSGFDEALLVLKRGEVVHFKR